MAKIYRTSDRLKLKVDDLVFVISPLSYQQKMDINSTIMEGGAKGAMDGARLAIKYALKDVEGLENADGSSYDIKLGKGESLDDEVIDDLFNLRQSTRLSQICLNLINGVPDEFIDPRTGEPLEGVSLIKEKVSRRPKK